MPLIKLHGSLIILLLILASICLAQNSQGKSCFAVNGRTKNKPCVFPFTVRGETYDSCTYVVSHLTNNTAWCSTKTDSRGVHVKGNVGYCESAECPIPPRECGVPINSELVDRGADISIQQMPWMASLGRYNRSGHWNHECGGSLVTNYHVLTAAHCFEIAENYIDAPADQDRYKMRLGNSDLNYGQDASHEEIRNVKRILIHPDYRSGRIYYDVGLAVAERRIEYTDYIRPICLPFKPIDDEDAWSDDLVILAGWGRDNNENVTNKLELDNLRANSPEYCRELFSEENVKANRIPVAKFRQLLPQGLRQDHISCAGFEFVASNACKGDSGSPLIRIVTGTKRKPYYEQGFLVSAGITDRCNFPATLYVRISSRKILTWIQKQTNQSPLLMVVGGYSPSVPNGLLADVEMISPTEGNACSKRASPLPGPWIDVGTHLEKVSAALGMTGQVTKDQPIVCGGKNGDDNQRTCYKYDPITNKWNRMQDLLQKRYQSSSVLDENGNLWLLGGVDGSSAADSTEIFDYRRRRWRKGRPLPASLRDSGLSSHCTVSINRTHILLAGGFANDYTFRNPDPPNQEVFVAGKSLSKAWMYDGNYWEEVPDMSTARDRPACSILQLSNGEIRILVAGGCNGWCVKNPAIKSAEMFNPETRTWTRVADMPRPLSSAKMELFDGLPTVVGGFDNEELSENLYQYHADRDRWIAHPSAKMRIPRSSAAVFQVPKSMFPYC